MHLNPTQATLLCFAARRTAEYYTAQKYGFKRLKLDLLILANILSLETGIFNIPDLIQYGRLECSRRLIYRYMAELKESGFIARITAGRQFYNSHKYQLTTTGRQVLKDFILYLNNEKTLILPHSGNNGQY